VSWEQLLSIRQEQQDMDQEWRDTPPVACPNDGAVLQQGDGGELNCPMGDYRYPRDGHPADRHISP
jgi:hypothetical protein